MIILDLIFAFLIVFIAGKTALTNKYLNISDQPISIRLPLFFFAGTAVIAQYMFLLALLHIKYSMLTISLPFLIYLAFTIKGSTFLLKKPNIKVTPLIVIMFSILGLICIAMLTDTLTLPISAKDAFAMWVFKAKMIFDAGTIPFNVLQNKVFYYTSTDYPLLVPLNLAWINICIGSWNDIVIRTFYALSYISFIPLFYSLSRKYMNSTISAIATFVLLTNSHLLEYAANGYVDVLLGMFAFISIFYLLEWVKNRKESDLLISSMFMGSAAFIKNDAIALFVALFLVFLVVRPKLRESIVMCSGALLFVPFKLAVSYYAISNHMIKGFNLLDNLNRIPVILNHYVFELFLNTYSWQYFWIFIALLLIIGRKKLMTTTLKYAFGFLLAALSLYFLVYMITVADNLTSSFHRLLLGLAPISAFLAFASLDIEES
jgi:hypothetical protein